MLDIEWMTLVTRAAIVAALLFAGVAIGASFLPTSPDNQTCGRWFAPEWTEERTAKMIDRGDELADEARAAGRDDIAATGAGLSRSAAESYRTCDDALDTRRNLAGGAAVLAILAPAAVLFIGRGAREKQTA